MLARHIHPLCRNLLPTPLYPNGLCASSASIANRTRITVISSASAVSSSLISVLKDELKFERESYRRDEELLRGPPNGFELEDPEGKNAFYLMREYKNEAIVIAVDLDSQPKTDLEDFEEDDDGDYEEIIPVNFKVSIAKGNKALVFDCQSNGEFIVINHLAFESRDHDDDEPAYTGPVFDDLDDTLQQAFLDFLEERGISSELGDYLRLMTQDKQSVEYQAWLSKVRDFIAQ